LHIFSQNLKGMKKSVLVLVCSFFALAAWSLNYCQTSAWGYGGAATGGGNATPTLVNSYSALKTAMNSGNKVIIITQSIAFSDMIECSKSNLTIIGMPGVVLSNSNKDKGIFKFKSGSNFIIRNLAFKGPGATNNQGGDLLCFEGSSKAWVDHCSFQDGSDGNFDICKGADDITVTWCRFLYTIDSSHNFSNLVGSSATDKATDGTFNVTYGYCWWDQGCAQRMPRSRNAQFHLLNCYWNSSKASYYLGLQTSTAYIEGCYFGGSLSGGKIMGSNNSDWYDANTIGFVFVNCVSDKTLPSNNRASSVTTPTYTYPTALTAAEAKTAVTNSTCGAGPTLTVTTAGAISSTCDGDNPTLNDPTNKSQTVTAGTAISSITFTATNATNISVTGLPAGLTSSTNGMTLTISGTPTASGTYTVTATNASGANATAQGTITVGTIPGPTPTLDLDTIKTTTLWNFSTSAFSGLGKFTTNQKVNGLLIAADDNDTIVVDANKKSIDGYSFTSRIKTGGAMTSTARFFAFCVTGNCTIEIYCISGNSSTNRTMNVATGSWNNIKQTFDVGTSIAKYTYSYTGAATSLYIGSAAGGINFYAIKVIYSSQPEAKPTISDPTNKSQTVTAGTAIEAITYTASGTATDIAVSGLPAGLSAQKSGLTLTISGTPTASGTYTITATDAQGGSTTSQGTITVNTTPGPGPTPGPTPQGNLTWNISDSIFSSHKGDIAATTTIDGLTLVANSSKKMAIESVSKTYKDGDTTYVFTYVLKTKGGMGADYRHFQFDVTGSCTVDLYCYSGNGNNVYQMNVYQDSVSESTLLTTLEADKVVCKRTYSYTGKAATLIFGGHGNGIHLYGIRLTYPTTPTALDEATAPALPSKILRNGQILILHNGHYYNLQGLRVGD